MPPSEYLAGFSGGTIRLGDVVGVPAADGTVRVDVCDDDVFAVLGNPPPICATRLPSAPQGTAWLR